MNILVCCYKKDYYFAKICVASIRYFYPDIPIYLLKDELAGKFDTSELEKNWNVQEISFDKKEFGWSAGKIFFYTDARFLNQRFLVIDADIVFLGKLLDEEWVKQEDWDAIVSGYEEPTAPYGFYFTRDYFNAKLIEKEYPDYSYPGYVFNCGQLFIKGGALTREHLTDYFDFSSYPFWKRPDIFPLVDQSVFNFLFPMMEKEGTLALKKHHYMLWSEDPKGQEMVLLENIKNKTGYPLLIHWAGGLKLRVPLIEKMSRNDILFFFEDYYYSRIPGGAVKRKLRSARDYSKHYFFFWARKIKNILLRKKGK